jgi:SAM-dependent methyltransferase
MNHQPKMNQQPEMNQPMKMNQPPDFNPLARLYRWMEFTTFGPFLTLTRGAFLDRLTEAKCALVLGDGDGRFTARLVRENPTVQVDAVDASGGMLNELLHRAQPHEARVRVYLADARTWQTPAPILGRPYDLIATHFFLDCLSTQEVRSLAGRLGGAVSPSALWVVSEFAVPPGWFGRFVARPVVGILYFCFGLLTGLAVHSLPDHGSALRDAGFTLLERKTRLAGLLIAELWSAGGRAVG